MIFFLITKCHNAPMDYFLTSWGESLASRIQVVTYDYAIKTKLSVPGTYIFADIERLSSNQIKSATEVWEQLSLRGNKIRMLNHPAFSMRRFELLRTLHEHGINEHNIYRLNEDRIPQRFPIFLRYENSHMGALTPLLHTPADLEASIAKLLRQGEFPEDILIVEFTDTSDSHGIFRKYAAFFLENQVIPRHIFFSREWMLKLPELADEMMLREELQYITDNPHEKQIREAFHLARINYGRIDYGVLNGKIQVWEINTNPMLAGPISTKEPKRWQVHTLFARNIISAFEDIDCGIDTKIKIHISIAERVNKLLRSIFNFVTSLLPYPFATKIRSEAKCLSYRARRRSMRRSSRKNSSL